MKKYPVAILTNFQDRKSKRKKTEIWKPIEGYDGMYDVSNFGRIRSVGRVVTRSNGRKLTVQSKILKPSVNNKGYSSVALCDVKSCKQIGIHTLVLLHFGQQKPSSKHEVNHKDGNPANNYISNLEWVTRSENLLHAYATGLANFQPDKKFCRGQSCPWSKLTEDDVLNIRELKYKNKYSQKEMAVIFNVSEMTISQIVRRLIWTHI